jgi:hypothetical protein
MGKKRSWFERKMLWPILRFYALSPEDNRRIHQDKLPAVRI